MTRAAGALLAVGLGTSAGDVAARLGAGGSLSGVRELAQIGLVHDRHVGLLFEDRRREGDLPVALAERVEVRNLHCH